jgi:hypothetical protein
MRRFLVMVVAVVLLVGAPAVRGATHASSEDIGPAASFGWGMGAVGTNLFYIPAKVLYAVGGSFVSLVAWGVSAGNSDVALGILQPALSGTWVVTPEMLRGEDPILFVGPSYEPHPDR